MTLIGCQVAHTPGTTQAVSTAAPLDPVAVYAQAVAPYSLRKQHSYTVSRQKHTKAAGQIFFEDSEQSVCMQNLGTEAFAGIADQTLQIGENTIRIVEQYQDGNAYFSVNQGSFTAPMTAESYISRYVPIAALDPSLYQYTALSEHGSCTRIGFAQPAGPESWAMPAGAEFVDATAIVTLQGLTKLICIDYSICYRYGNTEVTTRVKISPQAGETVSFPRIDAESYTPLQTIDAPRILEQACGYLLQASQLDAEYAENMDCKAFGISRSNCSNMTLSGTGDDFKAFLKSSIRQVNHSRKGETTETTQAERFQNGTYVVATDGNPLQTDASVTADTMRAYCQDILVSTIALPQYITGARMTQTDSTFILDFTCSEALAEAICSNVCQTLYNTPTLLHTLSAAHSTDIMTCYLEVDRYTGLPIRAGICYSAEHVIEGTAYQLSSQTDQTYSYPH